MELKALNGGIGMNLESVLATDSWDFSSSASE